MNELIGALVAAVAALLYDVGYILEKQALDDLPPLRLTPLGILRVAGASPRWLVGFVAMLGGLALQVVALTRAPVAVVQPILAGGLIALGAVGSRLLGERLDRRHVLALGLVLVAVGLVAASAGGRTPVARRVPAGSFWSVGVVVSAIAGASVAAGRGFDALRVRAAGLVAAAVAAGCLYGLGAVAEKAVSTRLAADGLVDGAVHALATPYPWAFLVATLAGMVVFQVGLQAHLATLMASLTNTVSTVCALVGAAVVFSEPALPHGWWGLTRLGGFAAGAVAVFVLLTDPGDGSPVEAGAAGDRSRPDHPVAP